MNSTMWVAVAIAAVIALLGRSDQLSGFTSKITEWLKKLLVPSPAPQPAPIAKKDRDGVDGLLAISDAVLYLEHVAAHHVVDDEVTDAIKALKAIPLAALIHTEDCDET